MFRIIGTINRLRDRRPPGSGSLCRSSRHPMRGSRPPRPLFGLAGAAAHVEGVLLAPVILDAAVVLLGEFDEQIVYQRRADRVGADGIDADVSPRAGIAFCEEHRFGTIQLIHKRVGRPRVNIYKADVLAHGDELSYSSGSDSGRTSSNKDGSHVLLYRSP